MEHFEPSIEVQTTTQPDEQPDSQQEGGYTHPMVFWSVLLVALTLLTGMVSMVANGAIAVAASVPVPVTIQAGTLNGTGFHLYPGVSRADQSSGVGVAQMDCTINNMTITKQVPLPVIGNVNFTLTSGSSTPVTLGGLTTDLNSLGANQASFQNMSLNTGGSTGLDINSTSTTFTSANINSPYLLVNNITLPGLSISFAKP